MSDNIPFHIQMEIIKWLPVKPLIQFRSVSKQWKSFIDSSEFIKGYGARNTQPHSRILSYKSNHFDKHKYICLVDDDNNETCKVQQQEFAPFVMSPLLKEYFIVHVVGACHGLLCFYGIRIGYEGWRFVIWNPSIGKSFGIVLPFSRYVPGTPTFVNRHLSYFYGFGVCPVNRDPTVVKILCADFFTQVISCANNMPPWHVEVFTLSSGVWNVIPSDSLLPPSIGLCSSSEIAIDRFIYWVAIDGTFVDALCHDKYMVVSFDLITKKFKRVDLPDSLMLREQNPKRVPVSLSKLRGSLVVYGSINVEGAKCCDVWVMEHDLSFRKLFTIGARVSKILGFRKNGEPIFETKKEDKKFSTLDVYDPCSQQISYLGIDGQIGRFFMGSYKESLLLLDHSDLHIYGDDN